MMCGALVVRNVIHCHELELLQSTYFIRIVLTYPQVANPLSPTSYNDLPWVHCEPLTRMDFKQYSDFVYFCANKRSRFEEGFALLPLATINACIHGVYVHK